MNPNLSYPSRTAIHTCSTGTPTCGFFSHCASNPPSHQEQERLEPAMSLDQSNNQLGPSEDGVLRPSHDSQQGLLNSAKQAQQPKVQQSPAPEGYIARLDFDPPAREEPPPPRHPSRQMMRWGPPPSEYGWDDREERIPHGRASYDYGTPSRGGPMPAAYYPEDAYSPYYPRPYRRASSKRHNRPLSTVESDRGPPPPRGPPRGRARYEDPSESESSEDEIAKRKQRRRREREEKRSPSPEMIMRLPFTAWMNGPVKGRKSIPLYASASNNL